ncbi:MAG: MaoC family dehydratase [Burkholderiaceae bacterium]|jgi:acyl dehydratase|nr:MaoC family dehydratase [Burkholderiaceae bacterium]HMN63520.1 MaoC family dehydratase [Burkholderiaceae bacterium]
MAVPFKERYFEDFRPGEVIEFGDYLVTEEEIVDFARRYDPQPFHVDRKAAAESIYGGLIASGWMTGSIMMRLLVDHFIAPASSMGSPGVDEVRWSRPVRPGDRLHVRVTIVDTKRSQSKPDRGIVQVQQEMINQQGDTVMSLRGMSLSKCRTPAPA